jgi:hypothetical protein
VMDSGIIYDVEYIWHMSTSISTSIYIYIYTYIYIYIYICMYIYKHDLSTTYFLWSSKSFRVSAETKPGASLTPSTIFEKGIRSKWGISSPPPSLPPSYSEHIFSPLPLFLPLPLLLCPHTPTHDVYPFHAAGKCHFKPSSHSTLRQDLDRA